MNKEVTSSKDSNANKENNDNNEKPIKKIDLQRLYIKEQQCKLSYAPQVFKEEWNPEISMEMQINNTALENDLYEVILSINITAKNNQITATTMEVKQAGIFLIKGFSEEEKKHILSVYAPTILYPYIRAIITKLSVDATLPPIMIVPVNFEAMMQQGKTKQEQTKVNDKVETKTKGEYVN